MFFLYSIQQLNRLANDGYPVYTSFRGLSKRRQDDGTGDRTLAIDCPGKDYRIGTMSKVNNIIYCKNDVLAE